MRVSTKIDAMIDAGIKPYNDKWRPGKKLKKEMEEKGFSIDYDQADGFWQGCLYAPNGYRFKHSDAHCDCAVELSDKGIRSAMANIEKCNCEECQEYWSENHE